MNAAPATMAQPAPTTVPQVINAFWQVHAQNINSGGSISIEVPITLKNIIGDNGITIIATRLR